MKRSEQREHIFKLLFCVEFNPFEELSEQISLYLEHAGIEAEKDVIYITDKTMEIVSHLEEIDGLLNASTISEKKTPVKPAPGRKVEGAGQKTISWKTSRMNKADLTILRLATYEMKMDEDVPVSVAINEAVELAKRFGGEESPSFVNGILGKLAKQ
ncbi:MAG: transcription antitermination protein NusB [Eubacteriales bacterium]|nr:transcription antitermination protein NusB [Eubacteriales bacterium]